MKENLEMLGIGLVIIALIGGSVYLHYEAYHQRFPNAEPWTFLFQQ